MDSIIWSAGAFAFTQTAYLLRLVIPGTNVEMKKRKLHSSRRLSFNELNERKKSWAAE